MKEMKDMKMAANNIMRRDVVSQECVNQAKIFFDARSMNEGFARMVVMGFMMDMNPTMDELQDVKTAVSEAVTNAIIHGYGVVDCEIEDMETKRNMTGGDKASKAIVENSGCAQVEMSCMRVGQKLTITVEDHGIGIKNVEEARQPFFTTKPDMERSGMGFAFMETFMDEVEVQSALGKGTRVTMTKYITSERRSENEEGVQEANSIAETAVSAKNSEEKSGR